MAEQILVILHAGHTKATKFPSKLNPSIARQAINVSVSLHFHPFTDDRESFSEKRERVKLRWSGSAKCTVIVETGRRLDEPEVRRRAGRTYLAVASPRKEVPHGSVLSTRSERTWPHTESLKSRTSIRGDEPPRVLAGNRKSEHLLARAVSFFQDSIHSHLVIFLSFPLSHFRLSINDSTRLFKIHFKVFSISLDLFIFPFVHYIYSRIANLLIIPVFM